VRLGWLCGGMRNSTTPADRRLADLAGVQYGVVSTGQLREIGLDRYAVKRRVESGRLHRLHRGVYAVGHTIVPPRGRWLAAVLACGPGAVLSHRSAAALWGIRPTSTPRIDVTVSHTSGVRTSAAIIVHRPRRAVDMTTRERIPVTTAGQTLADLATALPRRQLEKAAEMAEALRLDVTLDQSHPGARRLEQAAAHDLAHTARSPLEDDFLALCHRHDIPRPRVNTFVEGYLVDFCWPAERLVVETDGGHHFTRGAFERDRARDALLTARGWRVMRFTTKQVRRGPERVAALVLSARSPSLATP
jgi:predicted transcriptional regulator of viral defense system